MRESIEDSRSILQLKDAAVYEPYDDRLSI